MSLRPALFTRFILFTQCALLCASPAGAEATSIGLGSYSWFTFFHRVEVQALHRFSQRQLSPLVGVTFVPWVRLYEVFPRYGLDLTYHRSLLLFDNERWGLFGGFSWLSYPTAPLVDKSQANWIFGFETYF